jgi:hypothetical protein
MNLEEARKVLWLPNYKRPLGELSDEGYLTHARLEWAARKAYDPALKQAAQVILESRKHPSASNKPEEKRSATQSQNPRSSVTIGMNLDQARAMQWPFSPYKGQLMGDLVESKQLTLKDLGFAIETAWDKKVRQAAIALSLVGLEQAVKEPDPPAGFIKIITGGRSYSEIKQARLTLLEGMFLGGLVVLMIGLVIWIMADILKPHPNAKQALETLSSPAGIVAIIIVLVLGIFSAWLGNFIPDQITKRMDKQIEAYRFGEEGEERTVQMIIQALDGNWSLIRNVTLPGRKKADLDLVLVGPPGVWVLEVKNYRGDYRNIGETWEYRHGNKWKSASKNPSRQARNNAGRLGNFLKADNLNVFVNPVVVWVNVESSLFVENPSVSIWPYNRLPDELGNIWQKEKLSEAERNKIAEKLENLCERQKKADIDRQRS